MVAPSDQINDGERRVGCTFRHPARIPSMRLKHLVGLLKRTAGKVEVIAVERLGWPTQMLPINVVVAMVEHDESWIGVGPKRKLDAVVYDPPPKPDPEWVPCWRNTHAACLWTEGHYEAHQA